MTQEQIEKLIDFVKYYATCPCCGQAELCNPDCTFEGDDGRGHLIMTMARDAMKGIDCGLPRH